ncbi:U3 small nucleolar RNA-associated protein 23, partial [Tremellales sp. Uapishka_1]
MRQKRAKSYKRLMSLYTQTFNFRQPFQVLVSNDILLEPALKDLDLVKGLGACVQGECKPMITQCCIEALYKLGRESQWIVDMAKNFERRRCNHREAIEPEACVKDVVGTTNKHRYILAIQNPALLVKLQTIPGLPMIHFNPRGVLVLSPASTATLRYKQSTEEERRKGEKEKEVEVVDGDNVVKRVKPKVKGVNPLSVKKKKAAVAEAPNKKSEEGEGGKKRVRIEEPDEEELADEEGPEDEGRKKKKRKRKGKGEVAMAIAELNATNAVLETTTAGEEQEEEVAAAEDSE